MTKDQKFKQVIRSFEERLLMLRLRGSKERDYLLAVDKAVKKKETVKK